MNRWTPVPPQQPWEVPVSAVVLVASALCVGRPGGLEGPRFNGDPDDVVAEAYQRLRRAVVGCAVRRAPERHAADVERFARLEALPPGSSSTRWQTWVVTSGAADDAEVIDLARAVWGALGEAEYQRQFCPRPRTWRGSAVAQAWLAAALLPALAIFGSGARHHAATWLVVGGAGAWVLLTVGAFLRWYRRKAATPWAELPHP